MNSLYVYRLIQNHVYINCKILLSSSMKNQYQIAVKEFNEVQEISGAWTNDDYIRSLNKIV